MSLRPLKNFKHLKQLKRAMAGLACLVAVSGAVWAQGSTLAPGQVSGAQIEAWLQADGFPAAGVFLSNRCHFMAIGAGDQRVQYVRCPDPTVPLMTVKGQVRVVGNQFCTHFNYPDGSVVDRCHDLIQVGENKYELRTSSGQVSTVLYHLKR